MFLHLENLTMHASNGAMTRNSKIHKQYSGTSGCYSRHATDGGNRNNAWKWECSSKTNQDKYFIIAKNSTKQATTKKTHAHFLQQILKISCSCVTKRLLASVDVLKSNPCDDDRSHRNEQKSYMPPFTSIQVCKSRVLIMNHEQHSDMQTYIDWCHIHILLPFTHSSMQIYSAGNEKRTTCNDRLTDFAKSK